MLTNAAFWQAVAERSAKTFAQTFAALIGAGAVSIITIPAASPIFVSPAKTERHFDIGIVEQQLRRCF